MLDKNEYNNFDVIELNSFDFNTDIICTNVLS